MVAPATAQEPVPHPERTASTVFRCETLGQITYSDQPCAGAQRVDALRLPGANRVAMAESTHATTPAAAGWGYGSGANRSSHARTDDPECPHLAQRMARVEAEEQRATAATIGLIQQRLAVQRERFRELACATPVLGAG
jgi:hypothetical protein